MDDHANNLVRLGELQIVSEDKATAVPVDGAGRYGEKGIPRPVIGHGVSVWLEAEFSPAILNSQIAIDGLVLACVARTQNPGICIGGINATNRTDGQLRGCLEGRVRDSWLHPCAIIGHLARLTIKRSDDTWLTNGN
ncbi:hypothetical protein JK207_02560 [Gluconobacter cerinus]|uniref:hypothetical protein n=1 Tax=Gluconobacter cerinus TaxID=38307 RepID=UPI001B8CA03E|nr:hypothetical protein [Gluconobacter cerinus]MBS1020920.1 hypothetical protein [Gluconobacter cerinus]